MFVYDSFRTLVEIADIAADQTRIIDSARQKVVDGRKIVPGHEVISVQEGDPLTRDVTEAQIASRCGTSISLSQDPYVVRVSAVPTDRQLPRCVRSPVVHDDDFHPMPQRLVLAHETLQAPVNIVTDVVGSNDDRITSAPALIELGILSTQSGS